ncbi:purine and uridine phosphorylase [Penicillium cf. viridicatum]|uniref:Purine and uridine phosphorylase n=1 Tax=Penicillium cf. viridicatum TaxID=2972119 RepID=A0A9W9IY51_9EURO|nr:purine and uridine phosphorylase [Penicillium cf. viridicatum]
MGDRGQENATLTHENYTVGWVCALPKEIVAAKAMFDQVHPPLPQPPHDSNNYTLGRVGSHNVVIAYLPLGELGNNSSASMATRLNSTFPGIKFGIMVGIGGGVPPSVRLGDVVDFGKTEQGTGFRRTGSLNGPPTILKTALSTLQAKHEMEGSVVPKFLEEVERKWPMLAPRYTLRENLEDMLLPADFQHVTIQDVGERQNHCAGCDRSKLLQRKHRDMRVHYGLIASGNQVVKDGIFRDEINSRFGGNVLCFEMEAAGLMNEFRCVVVRGICDYADSHKPKHWQEYAAAVAAATAKEILLMVPKWDVLTMAPIVPNDVEALQYFKLLLLREGDIEDKLRESIEFGRTKRILRESGITAEDCIADYLRAIWKHTLETIRQARPKYGIKALKFYVVLTVPATWKDYARNAMQRAASKAGILDYRKAGPTSLTFVPEPVAAGLAALVDRGAYVESGNVFVVCDAGGGTVDVITYIVVDNQPLQLQEAVPSDGSLCGGIFIDEAFVSQLKNRIGRKWSIFTPAGIMTMLTKEWEYGIKPRYAERNGRDIYPLFILQPQLRGLNMNEYIYFSGSDIRNAFHTKAVPGLLQLVDTQLSKAHNKGLNVTGILLDGGLGSSPHIYECLEAKYSNRGIDIHQSVADGS